MHLVSDPAANEKLESSWTLLLPPVASNNPRRIRRCDGVLNLPLPSLSEVVDPDGRRQYQDVFVRTSDCVEVVTKHFHGKWFTQLLYPGRVLQCPKGVRVFVTDVTAPNKSHYVLTASLRVDTGRLWLTYELDPLLKDANKKKVPQFSVTSEATHLSPRRSKWPS